MKISKKQKIARIGITMGDPSGIGPAIIKKALARLYKNTNITIIGDRWVFDKVRYTESGMQNVKFIDLKNVARSNFSFGRVKAEYGRASIEYLDKALGLIENNELDCLVTCPISKESINLAGYRYTGHTEYLAEKTKSKNTVMMLLNKYLKFALITRHVALKHVSLNINQEKILQTSIAAYVSLKKLFLIKNPRMVICGLNPHASDNGLLGDEENRIIMPAVKKLREKIKHLEGPLPADIAISKALHKDYDCIIAMYHDQALIPLKLSGFSRSANLTLGLNFIRTSPLHGTAFDIAKYHHLANFDSLLEAIKLAYRCALNQKRN